MSIPVNFNSLFTSLYIVMYNSQSLVSNTVASLEHIRLIQSLATTDYINHVSNMSVESFRCSHRWVPSIEFGILHEWFYFSEFVFWWIFVNMAHLPFVFILLPTACLNHILCILYPNIPFLRLECTRWTQFQTNSLATHKST